MDILRKKQDSECTIAGLYDLSETIGKGHFAVVKLAKHVFTGEKVAVKVIDKTKLDPISRDHLFQEVRCMKLVQHPHIVRLYEVIDTQTKLYLVLELGDGDMYDYIMNNHDRGLDIETARTYFTQILEAISYCHDLHVVHRDLKPENVIFFEKLGIVKLTDFGFSNRFEPDTKLDTSCGSLAYSAPEILLGDSYDAPAVDVWSLGVLLYMLVCGDPPFQEANDSETLTMIMDCKYRIPSHIPPECANLISSMLRREPTERISLRNIVHHPWMINTSGKQCCDNSCVALVGRENLAAEDHDLIIHKMVEGGIASRTEILRALESDEYSNVTATFYLLAERKLKRQHTDLRPPISRNRPSTVPWPPRLEHSLSTPEEGTPGASERVTLEPSPKSAPYDQSDSVFSAENTFPTYTAPGIGLQTDTLTIEHQQRKFSLIEEGEEESDTEDSLNHNVLTVKETKSSTWGEHTNVKNQPSSMLQQHHSGSGIAMVSSEFEQSLSNMSLKRGARPTPSNQCSNQPRPLRTVTSSPQLLPLKQIHEEQEIISGDEDALSTHSQTSVVRIRHSSLSMASPEVARKLLSKKKLIKHKAHSGSDTSDNDDDKHSSRERDSIPNITTMLNLPHKRKDSGNSSDNDGPSASGGGGGSNLGATSSHQTSQTSCKDSNSKNSPCAKKKYSGNTRSSTSVAPNIQGTVISNHSHNVALNGSDSGDLATKSDGSYKPAATHITDTSTSNSRKTNGNNNNKDGSDNSLRVLANKFVDSSLARLSNFSLASQTSSISSRSSVKYSTNTTPRSSQRNSKDGKFSKSRLMQNLKMDFNELSDREMTDSDCGSMHNSLRIKFAAAGTGTSKEYSVITEEQTSQLHSPGAKKTTECCSVM